MLPPPYNYVNVHIGQVESDLLSPLLGPLTPAGLQPLKSLPLYAIFQAGACYAISNAHRNVQVITGTLIIHVKSYLVTLTVHVTDCRWKTKF